MSCTTLILFVLHVTIAKAGRLRLLSVAESYKTSINILDLLNLHGVTCGNKSTLYRNSFIDTPAFLQSCFSTGVYKQVELYRPQTFGITANIDIFINSSILVNTIAFPFEAKGYINKYEFQLLYMNGFYFHFGIYSPSRSGKTRLLFAPANSNISVMNASDLVNDIKVQTISSIYLDAINIQAGCGEPNNNYVPEKRLQECPTDQSLPVILFPKSQSIEVRINNDVTIECQYVSLINITDIVWNFKSSKTKESKQIPNNSSNSAYSTTETSLVIKQFGQDDQGSYHCRLSNENGWSKDVYEINITLISELPAPIILEYQRLIMLGQNLTCNTYVYPEVQNVWWKLNDDVVKYNGSSVTEISQTTDDIGFYQCCAKNTVGENCSSGVMVGAKPIVLGINHTNEGFLGKPVNITCDVNSIPTLLKMEFLVGDELISSEEPDYKDRTKLDEALYSRHTFTYTILTNDTQFPDNGSYTCNATNDFGSTLSPPLFVEFYGVVFNTTPEYSVIYGQDITLYCNADSRPNITEVHWHQNNSCIRCNSIKNDVTNFLGTVLQIRNTSFGDAGNYTCHIINPKLNKTSNIMELIVIGGKPIVNNYAFGSEDPNNITVNQSDTIVLVCNYTSIPAAHTLTWTRKLNGETMPISPLAKGGTLTSPNLTFMGESSMEYDGNYTCKVANDVGVNDGQSILVKVFESIPMCPCDCEFKKKLSFWKEKNFTKEEMLEYLKPLMKEIEADMALDKVRLSLNRRKHTSAPDNRKSAKEIGAVGIVAIVCAFGMIVLLDILAIGNCVRNNRARKSRFSN